MLKEILAEYLKITPTLTLRQNLRASALFKDSGQTYPSYTPHFVLDRFVLYADAPFPIRSTT